MGNGGCLKRTNTKQRGTRRSSKFRKDKQEDKTRYSRIRGVMIKEYIMKDTHGKLIIEGMQERVIKINRGMSGAAARTGNLMKKEKKRVLIYKELIVEINNGRRNKEENMEIYSMWQNRQ